MESALQCSAMKDFAAVITAMGKPDTKLHALELAKQGDQRIVDMSRSVPGLQKEHVEIVKATTADAQNFREFIMVVPNTILNQGRMAAMNCGFQHGDNNHWMCTVPIGRATHNINLHIEQTSSNSSSQSASSSSFGLGPIGFSRNKADAKYSDSGRISIVMVNGEQYTMVEKCAFCSMQGQSVPINNTTGAVMGETGSSQSMQQFVETVVNDDTKANKKEKNL